MSFKKILFLIPLSIVILFSLFYFGGHRQSTETPRDNRTKISVRLGWQVNANSAGQIAALEKGFYREEGLEVELLPGGLDNPSVKTVGIGEDEIGFANAPDLVINARAAGAPIKIVAVIQQISYHGFWVKVDSPIHSPKDWEGKRVGVKYASPTYLIYQVLCKKLGIDRSKIKEVPLNYGLQPFLDGEIDVYPGAFTNEAISIELMGIGVRRFYPQNYGIETCSNVIFTTENMIKNKPHLVKKFVQATIKGWEWCLKPENAEESIDFLIKHSNHLQKDKERTALELNRVLVNPREKEKLALKLNISLVKGSHYTIPYIGWINKEKFKAIIGYMKEFGLLKEDIRVDDLIITRFLPVDHHSAQNERVNKEK